MRLGMASILVLSLSVNLAFAQRNTSGCRDAIDQYNSAVSDISSYLRRYANCVSGSQGRDDCYSEFRRLKSAQDDFESAVSTFGLNANNSLREHRHYPAGNT
jgi:hypothetical protein